MSQKHLFSANDRTKLCQAEVMDLNVVSVTGLPLLFIFMESRARSQGDTLEVS